MRKLSREKRALILSALVEGSSINSAVRLCGVSKITVLRLLADAGTVCQRLHDELVRGLHTARIQADEIWSFVACKDKNIPAHREDEPGIGSVWTWTVIDADSKLMISWQVGDRTNANALEIMHDAAGRITLDRVQLASDGYRWYAQAVREAFGDSADYSELQTIYGAEDRTASARYSPMVCVGCIRKRIIGNPDPAHINTSYVERANLTMRMGMRRFTRLTNGHSKKIENHCHAIALHFFYNNFIRKHGTIKTTPAVAAGIANKPWTLLDLVDKLEAAEGGGGRPNYRISPCRLKVNQYPMAGPKVDWADLCFKRPRQDSNLRPAA